jgi:hypothetical protein
MSTFNPRSAMIDRGRLAALRVAEDREFERRTMRSRSLRKQATAHLPLGVPMSWMSGLYRTPPIYIAGGKVRPSPMWTATPTSTSVCAITAGLVLIRHLMIDRD